MNNLSDNASKYDTSNIEILKDSIIKGKRGLFLGSSVTFGAASCEEAIPEYFARRLQCIVTKEAVSGTTLVDKDELSYVNRLKNNIDTKTSYDFAVCQLSTNDATLDLPLGKVSEFVEAKAFDTQTILGAMEYIIAYCKENWECPVFFYTGSRYESSNYEKMVSGLYELSDKWGVGVLDLWNNDEFNSIDEESRSLYMADPIHPTKAGYNIWWCPEIERQFIALYRKMANLRLWYQEPAKEWTDSLPLGNGRIGAMVFGGICHERIALNEDTLWSGYPKDKNNKDAAKYLTQARKMAFEGKYEELSRFIEEHMLGDYTESYLPLGDIKIDFNDIEEEKISDYYRELDMCSAVTRTIFTYDDITVSREAFVSKPDNAFVMRLHSDKEASVSLEISFTSQLNYKTSVKDNCIYIEGLCPSHVEPSYLYSEDPVLYEEEDSKKGIRFNAIVKIDNKGGTVSCAGRGIKVLASDEVLIKFVIRSSFNGFDKQPYTEGKDCRQEVQNDLVNISNNTYENIYSNHIKDFRKLFSRVSFSLDADEETEMPTDERLERFADTQDDKELYRLLFNYGRYLLISSSRPKDQPANLQGIWNQEYRAPWSSNYTLNINTEMNYWLAESCNLSECHEPLFDLISNLMVTGAKTAQLHYGASGVVSHHNSDIWCMSNPVGRTDKWSVGYAYWCMSFGWLCRHLYEHYEYTCDEKFLRQRTYPALFEAIRFYLDVLVEDENKNLIICPSTSPENAFIKDGQEVKISKTATMSTAIVREAFATYLKVCKILDINDEYQEKVAEAFAKLPSYKIGKRGNLMEWDEDYDDAELTHRHISHLYPLYPGEEITVSKTPELADAVKKALIIRGDGGTGWSLGWKINVWARLKDGDHAEKLLKNQLNFVKTNECDYSNGGGTYRNMFDAHPPFQIDGNFAATAGIAEMLLQNEDDKIILLPALPNSWKSGYIRGLCAKGGIRVDMYFKNHELKKLSLYNSNSDTKSVNFVCSGKSYNISILGKSLKTVKC